MNGNCLEIGLLAPHADVAVPQWLAASCMGRTLAEDSDQDRHGIGHPAAVVHSRYKSCDSPETEWLQRPAYIGSIASLNVSSREAALRDRMWN